MPTAAENAKAWDRLAGRICSCPPLCTDRVWGDRGTCDPNCQPCKVMRGQGYSPPPGSRKA